MFLVDGLHQDFFVSHVEVLVKQCQPEALKRSMPSQNLTHLVEYDLIRVVDWSHVIYVRELWKLYRGCHSVLQGAQASKRSVPVLRIEPRDHCCQYPSTRRADE
jgi:hypothetical protein